MKRTAIVFAILAASACVPAAPKEQIAQRGVCGLLIRADASAPIQDLNKLLIEHEAKFCRWTLGGREMLAFRPAPIRFGPEPSVCELSEFEKPNDIRLTTFKDGKDITEACFKHGIQNTNPEAFTLKDQLPTMPKRCFSWSKDETRSRLLSPAEPVWLVTQLYQEYTLPVFASHVDGDQIIFWLDAPLHASTSELEQKVVFAAKREGLLLEAADCNATERK